MIPRAILAVAYATDRTFHARHVKGVDADKKGYPGAPCRELGVTLKSHRLKNRLLRNFKEMKLDGYLGNDMKQN